jgi:hypothetical protein
MDETHIIRGRKVVFEQPETRRAAQRVGARTVAVAGPPARPLMR